MHKDSNTITQDYITIYKHSNTSLAEACKWPHLENKKEQLKLLKTNENTVQNDWYYCLKCVSVVGSVPA